MARGKVLALALISASLLTSLIPLFAEEDSKIKEVVRSFFDPTQQIGAKMTLNTDQQKAQRLYTILTSTGIKSKDLWGNRQYVFGYANLKNGTVLIFAWKNDPKAADISIDELGGIYSDERLSEVTDNHTFNEWKVRRAAVVGSFLGIKRKDLKFATIYPKQPKEKYLTGRDTLQGLSLTEHPLVVRIIPSSRPENYDGDLVTALEEMGTR